MKRYAPLVLTCLFLIFAPGCGTAGKAPGSTDVAPAVSGDILPTQSADEANPIVSSTPDGPDRKVIKISSPYYNWIFEKFKELHPDFPYEIKIDNLYSCEYSYSQLLVMQLEAGDEDAPDIYMVEAAMVKKFTEGEAARHAAPYRDLGLDLDRLVKEADIPQYVMDMGTNSEGQIVALAHEGTGGAFIYRRSIVKDVWGTDDPEIIKDKIGPGWDKFLEAAAQLKARGYGILSSYEDIWLPVKCSAEVPWVADGKLAIDPKREAFLDLAKQLHDNGYTNNTIPWTNAWYADMNDGGKKKIFGYLGPSWLSEYVIKPNCGGGKVGEGTYGDWAVCEPPVGFFWGGFWLFANKDSPHKDVLGDIIEWITLDCSETGFQYLMANGAFDENGELPASGTVLRKLSGASDFYGYQDVFEVFDKAARLASGKNITEYDETINFYWLEQVREYVEGRKTKAQTIADFKQIVEDELGIAAE